MPVIHNESITQMGTYKYQSVMIDNKVSYTVSVKRQRREYTSVAVSGLLERENRLFCNFSCLFFTVQ